MRFSELENYVDLSIDEDTKTLYIRVADDYRLSLDILGDYALNVDGSIAMNYNGILFAGSMYNGESIGMDIDTVISECQRLYEENIRAFESENLHTLPGEMHFDQCTSCNV